MTSNSNIQGNVYQNNNSVTFSGKPTGPGEFLNRMVEALDMTIDRRPKGTPRKIEN